MKLHLLIVGLLGTLAGCAPLAPYQRADLMTRVMLDPLDPSEAAMDIHIQQTREAVRGATGMGGGPCGCN